MEIQRYENGASSTKESPDFKGVGNYGREPVLDYPSQLSQGRAGISNFMSLH
jgi:hypothetical protein